VARAGLCDVPQGAVGVVNGQAIPRELFARALVDMLGRPTLDTFVDGVLVEQEAARRGITVTQEELQARRQLELELRMRRLYKGARMTAEEFRTLAKTYGWDEAATRDEIEHSITARALRIRLLMEKLLRPYVEITDEQVRGYYEWSLGERCSAAHIQVPDERTARKLMEGLQQRRLNWVEAVARYSLDRPSVRYNGRMLPVPASSDLGRTLQGLQPGEMTLYSDGRSWHVVQLIRHIPAEQMAFETVKESLKQELYSLRLDELADSWLAELHAKASIVPNVAPEAATRKLLGDDVAVFVNGEALSVASLGEALIEEFGDKLMGPFIERELIFQEARRLGIEVADDAMRRRLAAAGERLFAERAASNGMTAQQFAAFLGERGMSEAAHKARLVEELVSQEDMRATALAEQIAASQLEVTEQDVQLAYQTHYGERVDVRRIILDDPAQAEEVRNKALRGASFELLVQTESVEPHAWMDMGLVTDVTVTHPYFQRLKDLKEGDISEVIERQGKYHLLKLVARRRPSDPPPLESVRQAMVEEARNTKARARARGWLEKLKAEAQIEVKLR